MTFTGGTRLVLGYLEDILNRHSLPEFVLPRKTTRLFVPTIWRIGSPTVKDGLR
jgi:hypothetical protein